MTGIAKQAELIDKTIFRWPSVGRSLWGSNFCGKFPKEREKEKRLLGPQTISNLETVARHSSESQLAVRGNELMKCSFGRGGGIGKRNFYQICWEQILGIILIARELLSLSKWVICSLSLIRRNGRRVVDELSCQQRR